MNQWMRVNELLANPEMDGAPFWGYINPDRVTAIKVTMIHNSVTGYDRDVYYPEVVSPDLGTTRVLLNVAEALGFLSLSDAQASIKNYLGGRTS